MEGTIIFSTRAGHISEDSIKQFD